MLVTESLLDNVIGRARDLLRADLEGQRSDGLRLASADVLSFIAERLVVPILCAFAKDVVFDTYKSLQTKRAIHAAKSELIGKQLDSSRTPDDKQLTAVLVANLKEEGLSEDQSGNIARSVLDSVKATITDQLSR